MSMITLLPRFRPQQPLTYCLSILELWSSGTPYLQMYFSTLSADPAQFRASVSEITHHQLE